MRPLTLPRSAAFAAWLLAAAVAAAPPARAADMAGQAVKLPTRAVTLAPHVTELVFAAGAGDRIVATVTSSDYPPEAIDIPRIGNGIHVDVEKTVATRPDIVMAWLPSGAAQTLRPMMDRLHVPVIHSRPQTLLDIPTEIERFGRLFGTEAVAKSTAMALRARIHTLQSRYATEPKVAVFVEIGGSPLYTIGNDPLLADVLATCGAVNIYADTGVAAPQVTPESVLVRNPDAVIIPEGRNDDVTATLARWKRLRLPAAMGKQVFALNPDALFRPGPRLVDATEQLCAYLELVRR